MAQVSIYTGKVLLHMLRPVGSKGQFRLPLTKIGNHAWLQNSSAPATESSTTWQHAIPFTCTECTPITLKRAPWPLPSPTHCPHKHQARARGTHITSAACGSVYLAPHPQLTSLPYAAGGLLTDLFSTLSKNRLHTTAAAAAAACLDGPGDGAGHLEGH